MKVSHIEHLGIAVKNLEEAIPYWENVLGFADAFLQGAFIFD